MMQYRYIINGSEELILQAKYRFGNPFTYISNSNRHIAVEAKHALIASELFECNYDIEFSELDSLDSSTLDKLENCEINYLKMTDRINLYGGYQKRKDDFLTHVRYWSHILNNNNIDFVIFLNIPHEGYDFVLYSLCKLLNIKTYMFYHLPHRPGFTIMYLLDEIESHHPKLKMDIELLKTTHRDIKIDDISDPFNFYIKELINTDDKIIKPYTASEKGFSTNFLSNIINKLNNLFSSLHPGSQQTFSKKLENYIKSTIFRDPYLESPRSVNNMYITISEDPDFNEKYIYYPLHYQPELSTCPLGGQYVNQLLVVEMLSKAMPNLKIYVKDHPRIGNVFKNKAFYKNLKKLKNVKLINLHSDTYELINNSYAVATITGSAGLEAILKGKPLLMFGNRIYEHAPGVYKIKTFNDLRLAFESISEDFTFNLQNVLYFFKALEEITFEGVMATDEEYLSNVTHQDSARRMIEIIYDSFK